jgi:hypothetical protein
MIQYEESSNIIDKLYNQFLEKQANLYHHLTTKEENDLVAFTYGIYYILVLLKLDLNKIKYDNNSILELIDEIVRKRFLAENIKISDEEKLNDFIHDKNDVGFREYIPSGEG